MSDRDLCLICYRSDGRYWSLPHVHGDPQWKAKQREKMRLRDIERDLPVGTVAAIIEQAGLTISIEEFLRA